MLFFMNGTWIFFMCNAMLLVITILEGNSTLRHVVNWIYLTEFCILVAVVLFSYLRGGIEKAKERRLVRAALKGE
ncbi:hypothetical protein J2T15_003571 [Paenibacillus harenae]|uniref:Uncharacterized protein n=1 Tax=Paenibacillus harenae TaxID=306543 RepID=A0ABT9U4Y1_PAEHA|nr:hypothetical protein [Paenibacillus harenae]